MTTLVWIRNDFRLTDNPALYNSCRTGDEIIAVYIWSPEEEGSRAPGAASRFWLHHSLKSFQKQCEEHHLTFVIRKGPVKEAIKGLIRETGAAHLYWNRRFDPVGIQIDAQLKASLDIDVKTFPGNLLFEPGDIKNQLGKPYRVFTPFWKQCMVQPEISTPLPKTSGNRRKQKLKSEAVENLGLLSKEFDSTWIPGEEAAKKKFLNFLKTSIRNYKKERDFPAKEGTSRMSPHLHFGEISPRWMWKKIHDHYSGTEPGVQCYLSELGWREFAHHILYHFPKIAKEPLDKKFKNMNWSQSKKNLHAWQKGLTGYPIVDAGMRELGHTGWMHNRARMITGSFLVKDLLISWQEGEKWFWDTLVDADFANNILGWQWVGGCGADAAPFFRIFNPVTQGEKFDPNGDYVRTWVPELTDVPVKWIHNPWEAPKGMVHDYPQPMVDHRLAREKALKEFNKIRG